LGAGEFDKAEESCWRILVFSVLSATGMGLLMAACSTLFPAMYNTTQEVRSLATGLLLVVAAAGPLHAFCHASYFTLRSGGKTWVTFLFDSAYLWVISIPVARLLSTGTAWHIILVYGICQFIDIVKCIIGYILLKRKVWINRIV
jgi:Na+-driven multidrug efflux pump